MITREYLEKRILELTAARDRLQADVNGNNGAIQLCRQLLASLEADATTAQGEPHEAAETGEAPKSNGEAPVP